MRHRMLTLAIGLVLAAGTPSKVAAQRGGGGPGAVCMPADTVASWILDGLRRIVIDPSAEAAATRELRKLPATTASQVTYVTDNAVCGSAEQAYTANVVRSTPATPSGTVYVFKIKDVYMVADTAQKTGEYFITMTLNKQFKLLARYRQ